MYSGAHCCKVLHYPEYSLGLTHFLGMDCHCNKFIMFLVHPATDDLSNLCRLVLICTHLQIQDSPLPGHYRCRNALLHSVIAHCYLLTLAKSQQDVEGHAIWQRLKALAYIASSAVHGWESPCFLVQRAHCLPPGRAQSH